MTEDDIVAACLSSNMIKRDAMIYALRRRVAGLAVWTPAYGLVMRPLIEHIVTLEPERASFLLAKAMVQMP